MNVLDSLVYSYNRSYHRTVKCRPVDVNKTNEKEIFRNIYGVDSIYDLFKKLKRPSIKKGDTVRIQKEQQPFQKRYMPKWQEETFTVHETFAKPFAPTYALRDKQANLIKGKFYQPEIQTVSETPESYFRVEKILETKGKGKNKQVKIRWLGYTHHYDSWIAANEIKKFMNILQ